MSTAGKVLVVLVALALVPWIYLTSLVYQLNANWGKEIENLNKQLAETSQKADEAKAGLAQVRDLITADQLGRDHDLTVLRAHLSEVENLLALTMEQQDRDRLHRESLEEAITAANAAIAVRDQEKQETIDLLAAERSEVDKKQADVASLMDRLAGLRKDFLDTMAQNRDLMQKAAGTTSGALPSRVRPASYRR
jgi:uncharacterized coiled-coil protein SlyX